MSQYNVRIEVSQMIHSEMSISNLQQHIKNRLSVEYLSIIKQKLEIKSTTNMNRDAVTYESSIVFLSLDEYNALRYNRLSSEDVYVPKCASPEPEPEFDAVDYLKNLMKKSR